MMDDARTDSWQRDDGLEADENRAVPGGLSLQSLFNRAETASQGRISAPC